MTAWMRSQSSQKKLGSRKERRAKALVLITVCQHLLLWTALFAIGSTSYLLIIGTINASILPPEVLVIASAAISLSYVLLHNVTAIFQSRAACRHRKRLLKALQWLSTVTLRLTVTLWLVTSGLILTMTAVRKPMCLPARTVVGANVARWDVGTPCVLQRSGIAAGLFALILTITLFVSVSIAHTPFSAHLLGQLKEESLQPFLLPQKSALHPIYSEMSFKCRSSSSLNSSLTLVPSSSDCKLEAGLFSPPTNTKAFGLGIYTPKSSMPSFLTPRPSLSSLRSYTTLSSRPPPLSPLPPLPAYFPNKQRMPSAMHRAIHPPRRAHPYERRNTDGRTVRIVPPSPALTTANLAAWRSTSSLSSVYSRDISGEGKSPILSPCSRSLSSESTATIKRSPLGVMRLANEPDVVVLPKTNSRSGSDSEDQIDDAATLQARLPRVKTVSEFGEVEDWAQGKSATVRAAVSYYERAKRMDADGNMLRLDFTPLTVSKIR